VLRQLPVDAETNEHKAALELLDLIPVGGKLVTGDAMFCQRDLSRQIRQKRGVTSGPSRTTSLTSWPPSKTRSMMRTLPPRQRRLGRRRAADRAHGRQGARPA
jgi:predicted transposase YbfD/YdcC